MLFGTDQSVWQPDADLRAFEIAIDEQAMELFLFADMAPKKEEYKNTSGLGFALFEYL